MYESLLLTADGGIDISQIKAPRTSDSAVIIGCGGAGINCLEMLKKKIYSQLEPDNPNDLIPRYSHIRFLAIDSDQDAIHQSSFQNQHETVFLQSIPHHMPIHMMRNDFQWLSPDLHIPLGINGAGGIRQLGRLLTIRHANEIYINIRQAITDAIEHDHHQPLTIHIITSTGGGTGSGSFADICYITQKVITDLDLEQTSILGYAILPDVILSKTEIQHDPMSCSCIQRNSYATFKELDHLMNLPHNHGVFAQNYGPFHVETHQPPMDFCHLISSVDANGCIHPNGYDRGLNTITNYIMAFLTANAGAGPSFRNNLSNIADALNHLPADAHTYQRYITLGTASAEGSVTLAANYLSAKLYKKMISCTTHIATDEDTENFAKSILHYSLPQMHALLMNHVQITCSIPEPPIESVKQITSSYVHSQAIIGPMNSWLQTQFNKIVSNRLTLIKQGQWENNPNSTYLIDRLFCRLLAYMEDPEYGPVYVYSLLNRNGKTLQVFLYAFLDEAQKYLQTAKNQEQYHMQQVEMDKQNFVFSQNTLFNRKIEAQAYKIYRESIGIWYRRMLDIKVLEQIIMIIHHLIDSVDSMNRLYIRKLADIYKNLEDTFEQNIHFLEQHNYDIFSEDGFTLRIQTLNQMHAYLEHLLNTKNPLVSAHVFTSGLIFNADEWLSGEESRIHALISKFCCLHLQTELSESLDTFLEQQVYPNLPTWDIANLLARQYFLQLYEMGAPLWQNLHENNFYSSDFIMFPAESNHMHSAAHLFSLQNNQAVPYPCYLKNRFTIIRIAMGIWLDTYHLLSPCKSAYENAADTPGIRIYAQEEIYI